MFLFTIDSGAISSKIFYGVNLLLKKILPSALDWLAAADNGAVTDDVKSVVKTIKVEDDVVELFDEDEELFVVVKELFDDDVNVVGAGVVGRDSPQENTAEEFPQVRVRVAVLSNAEKSVGRVGSYTLNIQSLYNKVLKK